MISKQETKQVEGWINKVQPSCSYLIWGQREGQLKVATCSNPDNQTGKCVYRNCPKVNNTKID